MLEKQDQNSKETAELVTFYIDKALCGINIQHIREINKIRERTEVPQAPDYVLGVLNLRGQIVTIIDLALKLGLEKGNKEDQLCNIIVNSGDGTAGFVVHQLGEVIKVQVDEKEKAPVNLQGIQGEYFSGVYKTNNQLIGLLDIENVMSPDY